MQQNYYGWKPKQRKDEKIKSLCRISICFPICAITIVSIFLLSIYSVFWREKNKLSRIRSFEVLWRWYIINTARLVSYHQSKNKPHLFIYTDQLHLRFHLCFLAYYLMQHHLYYGLRIRLLLFRKKFGKKNCTCVLEFGAFFYLKNPLYYVFFCSPYIFFILEREKNIFWCNNVRTYMYIKSCFFKFLLWHLSILTSESLFFSRPK